MMVYILLFLFARLEAEGKGKKRGDGERRARKVLFSRATYIKYLATRVPICGCWVGRMEEAPPQGCLVFFFFFMYQTVKNERD